MLYTSLLALSLAALTAADWPQWRGPQRDGHAPAESAPIESLPAEPKTVWKIKAGPGLASPIVAGETALLFDAQDGKETLHAVNALTGERKWSAAIDETFHDNQGPDGPRCTPVADGDRVYAVSCRGELQCLNLADGKTIWRTNFSDFGVVFIGEKGTAPGATRHGNNSTPLIDRDRLYVAVGSTNGASVVCFDKMTGKVIWKSQNEPAAYAPLMVGAIAGHNQLLAFTSDGLMSLDPQDGDLFWRVPIKTAFGRHATAPIWREDVVIVSSHQAGMIGTRVVTREGKPHAEQAWLSKEAAMNVASPVAAGNWIFGLGPRKNLECVEISSGRQVWSREGYFQTSADKAYAGFLVVEGTVLCLTDGGLLVAFKAVDKFEEVGSAQLCGANWCNPAYVDGKLYLRDGNKGPGDWMCVDLRASKQAGVWTRRPAFFSIIGQ